MANQKQAKQIRETILSQIQNQVFEGLEDGAHAIPMGRTSEGIVYGIGNDYVVIRAIVKSETFDASGEIQAYAEKLAKAEEKAKTKEK